MAAREGGRLARDLGVVEDFRRRRRAAGQPRKAGRASSPFVSETQGGSRRKNVSRPSARQAEPLPPPLNAPLEGRQPASQRCATRSFTSPAALPGCPP